MTTLIGIHNNHTSLIQENFETPQYQGHTISRVDASYLAKQDLKAGETGERIISEIFRAIIETIVAVIKECIRMLLIGTALTMAAVFFASVVISNSIVIGIIATSVTVIGLLAIGYLTPYLSGNF